MKIKKITLENHYILGNMTLDFTDNKGNILDTIIIAGENGTGKSTVLNLISELFNYRYNKRSQEKIVYELILSEDELNNLFSQQHIRQQLINFGKFNTIKVIFDTVNNPINNYLNGWVELINENGQIFKIGDIGNLRYMKLKSIFSDVEINFGGGTISSVTSKEIDQDFQGVVKSNNNLSQEITQLLIDIQTTDDSELATWLRESNYENKPPANMRDKRSKRFKNAFENMFTFKKYKGITTVNNSRKVTFSEGGKEIYLENLSSGEKQIVYRGSFCLKDKSKLDGSIAMVDEPEISLHPEWQKKIVPFYQDIFTNEEGKQTSQLFIVTHSPFIIHNKNRKNDKVIILKKDSNGNPVISDDNKFYGWSNEKIVKEAFNVNDFINETSNSKPLIITEGKTDWKHFKTALAYFKSIGDFIDLDIEFLEYENDNKMGDSQLQNFLKYSSKAPRENKVIGIFDSDTKIGKSNITSVGVGYKKYSKCFYGLCIDTPSFRNGHKGISVEQLYPNEDLKKEDSEGRRIFLSSEFTNIGKLKENKNIIYQNSMKIQENLEITNDKILDTCIFDEDDKSIALSKEDFAKNVLEKKGKFNEMNFEGFRNTFEKIETILELN